MPISFKAYLGIAFIMAIPIFLGQHSYWMMISLAQVMALGIY
jgi:hypothetical protein